MHRRGTVCRERPFLGDTATSADNGWRHRQQMILLTSAVTDPAGAAEDMAEQLLSTGPDDWLRTFGYPIR